MYCMVCLCLLNNVLCLLLTCEEDEITLDVKRVIENKKKKEGGTWLIKHNPVILLNYKHNLL